MQLGPKVVFCPACHAPKEPNETTCLQCGVRSCPNSHILSSRSRICPLCGWVDRDWKPQAKAHSAASSIREIPPSPDVKSRPSCPQCGAKVDTSSGHCPKCGALFGADQYQKTQQPSVSPAAKAGAPAPLTDDQYIVQQQFPGTHDAKLDYVCPRCGAKADPTFGHCPSCGYIGAMQYEIPGKKAAAPPPAAPFIPPPVMQQGTPVQQPSRPQEISHERSCPTCQCLVPFDSRFCPHCGALCGSGRSLGSQYRVPSAVERTWSVAPPTISPVPPASQAPPERIPVPYTTDQAPPEMSTAQPVSFPYTERPASRTSSIPISDRTFPAEKKERKAKEKEWGKYPSEKRGFPMGLLIAVMLVAAALIAMVIFVVSQEFHTPTPPTKPPVVDTTPPKIQSILASSITQTGAVITWVTDEPATSQVQICEGDVLCLPWTTLGDNYVKKHSVTVNDLKDNTTYHVTVKSIDEKGNEAISEMSKTFTTGSGTQTDTTPPAISEIDAISISSSGATITWTTNEEATSQVEYGTSTTYGEATQLDEALTASHSVSLSGLDSDTTYHFKIKSKDASDNEGITSTDHTFKTLTSIPVGPQLGKRAPSFTLENPAGESVTLSDYQGKIVMLNFWATWCTPCVAEMPHFQEIQENWSGDKDLVILAVNLRESATMVESWMSSKGYTFPVLLDPVGQVASLYNANTIPRTFFIDDEGIIREIKIGRFNSQSDIEIILDSL